MAAQGLGREHRPLSEINVTPFVDVMLVLLIIFMVTAPMLEQGIDVDLPETTTQPLQCGGAASLPSRRTSYHRRASDP